MITSRHVDEAYQSQELRAQIRDRFMLTLQLDQRYEVIAYAMSYQYFSDSEHSLIDGFSISWVRQEVLDWWPDGFHNSASEEAIRALLDEMVGLGILRSVGMGNYTLRSPNVVSLMGSEDEIVRVLESNREAPIEYEPAAFRTASHTVSYRRSPLTARQESALRSRQNGVSIIFGCRAAGLDTLEDFLTLAFGQEFLIVYSDLTDKASFSNSLSADLGNREKDGVTLVLVSLTCPWSESWVSAAIEKVQAFKSKSKFVRIVFVADPQLTWQLLSPATPSLDSLLKQGITTFSLQTWHDVALRQWLVDCAVSGPSAQEGRKQIAAATGNWPFLLENFYQRCQADPHRWERSLQELQEDLKGPFAHEVAEAFGLDRPDVRRVLHDLTALGEASRDDLVEVMEDGLAPEVIQQCLRWSDLLHLTTPVQDGCWRVDDLVARILPNIGS